MTGFVNIYKPEGISSTYPVNRLKRLTKTPCGHMGTLDPLAEGVLPIAVGNATRLFEYFLNKEKTYVARFRFGYTTPTLDREGEIEPLGSVPAEEEIKAVLPEFTGKIMQRPPVFSAVNVGGKRSYELARKGKEVELPEKEIFISSFRLLERIAPDEFAFEIVCGGGTYIRSLARDLAKRLQTGAYMTKLVRTKSGVFTSDTAVSLDILTPENVAEYLIPTDAVLPFPSLDCTDARLYNGIPVGTDEANGRYKLYRGGEFYGLAIVENGLLRTEKKLC